MARTDLKKVNTYGIRRRFKGRMVLPSGSPRSHGGVSSQSTVTFECGQTQTYPTKHIPGQFKVSMPRNRVRFP